MPVIIETLNEWLQGHSTPQEPPIQSKNGEWLCCDGAVGEGGFTGVDVRKDPPAETYVRLAAIKRYYQTWLDRCERDFDQFSRSVSQQLAWAAKYDNMPPPDETATLAVVADLQSQISHWQSKLAGVEDQLAATPEAVRERQLKAEREVRQATVAATRETIFAAIRGGGTTDE